MQVKQFSILDLRLGIEQFSSVAVLGSVRYKFAELQIPQLLSVKVSTFAPLFRREGGILPAYFIRAKSARLLSI